MVEKFCSRREFGKLSLLACAAGLTSASQAQKGKPPIGLQLYTLRDLTKSDFSGTLAKVARIGYSAVEFAGYGGLTAEQVRKLLDDLGLACCGTHEGYGALTPETLAKTIEFNQAIRSPFIICPSMPSEFRDQGGDGIKAFAQAMNLAGEQVRSAGMQLCYHNHDFEFKQVDGKTLYDLLLDNVDRQLVKMEIDTYWVKYAGVDPVKLISRLSGRCPLLHMKDMSKTEPRTFAPVGMGVMDIKSIVQAGLAHGTQWFVVEQDQCKGPALEAVSYSYVNLLRVLSKLG